MLAKTCQISQFDVESTCNQKAVGFVRAKGQSATALYQAGHVVCKGHGLALEDETQGTEFRTIAEIADMMTDEDRQAQQAQKETTMDVLPQAPADLVALATALNNRKVDAPVMQTPRLVDIPKAEETTPSPTVTVPSNKGAMLQTLREKAQAARESAAQTQAVLDANSLPDIAQEALKAAIAKSQREAASYEAQVARLVLTSSPEYQWTHASALRAELMLGYGSQALSAVETLIKLGVLTVSKGNLSVQMAVKAATPKATAPTSVSTGPKAASTQANEERNARVERMLDQGYKAKHICNETGLSEGTVAGITHRYNLRKAAQAA